MELDRDQKKVVNTTADKVLVVACAGSGKTRVLTERVRHLIVDKKVDPASIVAITLTNQAADEISMRLYDVPGINSTFIGTIHSMAYNILRNLGYNFKILTDDLDYDLHLELIHKYAQSITEKDYKKYRTQFLSYKLGLISENELMKGISYDSLKELNWMDSDPTEEHPVTIKSMCQTRNIIQFDDLLRFVINSGAVINIEHLLVDEFQDIGTLEYKFISSLNATNVFYVGDDWQSIYGFKGSNLKVFKSLYKDENYTSYILRTNYRSSKNIVDFSNQVISKDYERIVKPVKCKSEDAGEIICAKNSELTKIFEDIKSDGNFRDWFILARSNKDVVYLQTLLQTDMIPVSIFRREGMSGNDIKILMYENTVKLMTIHASKGLEADNVVLYGNYDTNLNATTSRMQGEEIRVFYVGVTRARKKLILVRKDYFTNNIDLSKFVSTKVDAVLRVNSVYKVPADLSDKGFDKASELIKHDIDVRHPDEASEIEMHSGLLPNLD